MAPGVVGVRAGNPLLGVLLQIGDDLSRGILGKPLAHEGDHASHMGRCLASAAESHVTDSRFPAVRPDHVRFDPTVRRWAPAAVTLNTVNIAPGSRPHR